jgi:hypothetical protein
MLLTIDHMAFWLSLQSRPRWFRQAAGKNVKAKRGPGDLIDRAVNAHAGLSVFDRAEANNLVNLLRMVRRNGQAERYGGLAGFLESLLPRGNEGGNTRRRLAFARKWAKRLRRQAVQPAWSDWRI